MIQSLLIQEMWLTKSNSKCSRSLRIKALNNQPRWSCKTQDMLIPIKLFVLFFRWQLFTISSRTYSNYPSWERVASRELSPVLTEQINLLVLYAVIFHTNPTPTENSRNGNITTQEVVKFSRLAVPNSSLHPEQ